MQIWRQDADLNCSATKRFDGQIVAPSAMRDGPLQHAADNVRRRPLEKRTQASAKRTRRPLLPMAGDTFCPPMATGNATTPHSSLVGVKWPIEVAKYFIAVIAFNRETPN